MPWRFIKAVSRKVWPLLSCAAFTILTAASAKWHGWWSDDRIFDALLAIAFLCLIKAFYDAWAEPVHRLDELAAHAEIVGEIYGHVSMCVNPPGEGPDGTVTTRVVVSALMVNKSPLVSPTIVNFICKMSLQDGEVLQVPYEVDLGNDYGTTHRDESGRQTGPWPSLAYFNPIGLVKDQHREGYLRFEVLGRFVEQEFTDGSLELIVVDGGGNKHQIGKIKWPYVRRIAEIADENTRRDRGATKSLASVSDSIGRWTGFWQSAPPALRRQEKKLQ